MKKTGSNKKLALLLTAVPVLMFGFGFALVPLYEVFCEVTGIRLNDGDGQIPTADVAKYESAEERYVTVHFDSAVDRRLPWAFGPTQKSMKVKVGELSETVYVAANNAEHSIVGHAVPSVAPVETSIYFAKTECFCFTEQLLAAGESKTMPVRFIIDPELPDNVKVMTLSYRFYNNEDATAALVDEAAKQETDHG